MVSLWCSVWVKPLCVITVEAVGGVCSEKMLHVNLILGKPFQAVTPRAYKPVTHAQWCMYFIIYVQCSSKKSMYMKTESIIHIF